MAIRKVKELEIEIISNISIYSIIWAVDYHWPIKYIIAVVTERLINYWTNSYAMKYILQRRKRHDIPCIYFFWTTPWIANYMWSVCLNRLQSSYVDSVLILYFIFLSLNHRCACNTVYFIIITYNVELSMYSEYRNICLSRDRKKL